MTDTNTQNAERAMARLYEQDHGRPWRGPLLQEYAGPLLGADGGQNEVLAALARIEKRLQAIEQQLTGSDSTVNQEREVLLQRRLAGLLAVEREQDAELALLNEHSRRKELLADLAEV